MPEFCLATSEADWVVLGEGEETIVDLLLAIRNAETSRGPRESAIEPETRPS